MIRLIQQDMVFSSMAKGLREIGFHSDYYSYIKTMHTICSHLHIEPGNWIHPFYNNFLETLDSEQLIEDKLYLNTQAKRFYQMLVDKKFGRS
jgi:hypothetical protein